MDKRRIGVAASVVGFLGLIVQFVPGLLLSRWSASGFQQELPVMFGTVGQTFITYKFLIDIAGSVVTVLLGIGLGYHVGQSIDLRAEYRRFLGVVGVGSTIGVLVPWAVIIGLGSSVFPLNGAGILLIALSFVEMLVTVALVVVVGAFAGAALAQFRADERSPNEPTDADSDAPSSMKQPSDSGATESQSRPAP